jgi:predicted RNase H-like HicB family nuclease
MIADYKIVIYRQEDESWVAEIPAISGCYALMPTRQEALAELENVFEMIAEEYRVAGRPLPKDTTEIVHAWRLGKGIPSRGPETRFSAHKTNRQPRTMEPC